MKSLATGISFSLPRLKCIPSQFEKYVHGEWIDRIPLPINAELDQDTLQISYDYKESLRIVVPWEIDGLGVFFLKTVSLPKRDEPYDLALEIARGTVGRLVDQTENWKAGGLLLSDDVENQLDLVKKNLRRATFCEGDERYQFAMVAIGASIHLMNQVGTRFAKYVFDFRRKEKQPNTGLLGAPFYQPANPDIMDFHPNFNTAVLSADFGIEGSPDSSSEPNEESFAKRCLELHRQGTTTCGGPIIEFRKFNSSLFDSVDDAECWMIQEASAQLEKGLSQCKLLMPVANLGHPSENGWNDPEQIHLTYELTTHIKEQARDIPLVVGFDQPFGEGQLGTGRQTPLQLADGLIRMEAPVAAFCLEINFGYYPDGTWIRDLFSFNDLLDSWAQFDYPLIIQLRIPGGVHARSDQAGDQFVAAGFDSQASWLSKIALLALAKQNVAGVFYAQVYDSADDDFFGAGLISSQQNGKPAMDAIRKIRQFMA